MVSWNSASVSQSYSGTYEGLSGVGCEGRSVRGKTKIQTMASIKLAI
jgi:hypothetical protein